MKAPLYAFTVLAVVAATLSGCYDLAGPGPMGDLEALGENPEISGFDASLFWTSDHPEVAGVETKVEGGVGTVRFEGTMSGPPCLVLDGYVRRGEGVLQFEIHASSTGGCPAAIRVSRYHGVLRQLDPGSYRVRILHPDNRSEEVMLDTVVVVE